jgi:hypothetical protein
VTGSLSTFDVGLVAVFVFVVLLFFSLLVGNNILIGRF